MDHYGAVVDLIGRASRIKEVSDCTQNMPIGLGITVCGATLDASKFTKMLNWEGAATNYLS